MKENKKGQSDMITTILLILVALAAITLVALFIMNQIRTGTATAEARANCLKLGFSITKSAQYGSVTVMRTDNELLNVTMLKVIANGATWNDSATAPASLETVTIVRGVKTPAVITEDAFGNNITTVNASYYANLLSGQKVEIGAILKDGTACASVTSAIVP